MKIKISRPLLWLRPYLEEISLLIPKLNKVKQIKGRTPSIKYVQHSQAHIICDENGFYKITLNYCFYFLEKIRPPVRRKFFYTKVDILRHLAHELAHLIEWNHSPEHLYLEARYLSIFADRLKREGYISEEKEESETQKKSPIN